MPKTKKFVPIYGSLEKLTPQQKEDYVLAACEFLQVPPELGLVRLALMDSGDGARQELLYVLKGATDIIRDRRKIDVDSLEPANGEGYVGWIVKGHDSTGRHEMAVGTVSTKGLAGKPLADTVMTAQTKSLRRMTLQFAGGGFLDETEVSEKTTNLASAAQSFSQIAQPTVQPNAEAGKDITEEKHWKQCLTCEVPVRDSPEGYRNDGGCLHVCMEIKRPRGRPRKNGINLDLQDSVATTPVKTPKTDQDLGELRAEGHAPRAEILGLANSVAKASAVQPPSVQLEMRGADRVPDEVVSVAPEPMPMTPEPVISSGTKVTKEQEEEYRKRLSKYINEILPPAGFLQSEKFGGRHAKMKLFFKAIIPDANTKNPTVEQWEQFFKFLVDKQEELKDTKLLVNLINETIGDVNVPSETVVA